MKKPAELISASLIAAVYDIGLINHTYACIITKMIFNVYVCRYKKI